MSRRVVWCVFALMPLLSMGQTLKPAPLEAGLKLSSIIGQPFELDNIYYFGCRVGTPGYQGIRLCYMDGDTVRLVPVPMSAYYEPDAPALIEYQSGSAFTGLYDVDESKVDNRASNGYIGQQMTLDDKAYMGFKVNSYQDYFTSFDGTTFVVYDTLNKNEEGYGMEYVGSPFVFDYDLYVVMKHNPNCYLNENTRLYKFDHGDFKEIALADNLVSADCDSDYYKERGLKKVKYQCTGEPIAYNGDLYYRFTDKESDVSVLGFVENDSVFFIPNPEIKDVEYDYDLSTSYLGSPIHYNGKLYLQYLDMDGVYRMFEYDGTAFTEVPSPFKRRENDCGYLGSPVIFEDNLYFRWRDPYYGEDKLCYYDGKKIREIKNKDNTLNFGGYMGSPVVYNNTLFVRMALDSEYLDPGATYSSLDENMNYYLYSVQGKKLKRVKLLNEDFEHMQYYAPLGVNQQQLLLLLGNESKNQLWIYKK